VATRAKKERRPAGMHFYPLASLKGCRTHPAGLQRPDTASQPFLHLIQRVFGANTLRPKVTEENEAPCWNSANTTRNIPMYTKNARGFREKRGFVPEKSRLYAGMLCEKSEERME
jgi:hypothetical protein